MSYNLIYILTALIVFLNLAGNILIKKGALVKGSIFVNRYTPCGYVLFLIVMIIALKLITVLELKYFSLIMAVNYFMTYMAGIVIFKEKTNKWSIAGIVFVCLGMIVFYL